MEISTLQLAIQPLAPGPRDLSNKKANGGLDRAGADAEKDVLDEQVEKLYA